MAWFAMPMVPSTLFNSGVGRVKQSHFSITLSPLSGHFSITLSPLPGLGQELCIPPGLHTGCAVLVHAVSQGGAKSPIPASKAVTGNRKQPTAAHTVRRLILDHMPTVSSSQKKKRATISLLPPGYHRPAPCHHPIPSPHTITPRRMHTLCASPKAARLLCACLGAQLPTLLLPAILRSCLELGRWRELAQQQPRARQIPMRPPRELGSCLTSLAAAPPQLRSAAVYSSTAASAVA